MSKERYRLSMPTDAQIFGLLFLSIGFYGVALGEVVQLLLEWNVWPGVMGDDAFMAPAFGSLGFIFLASILMLIGLLCLKVHWLAVIAAFLFAILCAFWQGQLFPTNPAYFALYWYLTYGGLVVMLSFLCLAWVKGVWPMLWRVLLVALVGAGIALTFFLIRGPDDWKFSPGGSDVILVVLIIGLLIPFVGYRLLITGAVLRD
ncbi:MAG TPA: hypothetical protein VFN35_29215 [Ktedonobacteraceae bacterium]|nr:hypothetical protein [Ktedonobacteraceae bacterium]